jgi:hypothetical protein
MKKVSLLCGMLLALIASVAAAGEGTNLRWNACLGDGGSINRNFACNTNSQNHVLVGGFELAAGMLDVSGNEIVVDIASASPNLPAWWHFRNAGTCRQSALTFNTTIDGGAMVCADWGSGLSVGGVGAYNIGVRGPNTSRIVAATAVPPSALAALSAGQEYFSFNVVFTSAKTVGDGRCAGCEDPVCIVFNSINLTTPVAANNRKLIGPANGFDSDFATWQGGGGVIVQGVPGCGAATPTRNVTWGSVKSLYR